MARVDTPFCVQPSCQSEEHEETPEHRWWGCKTFDNLRPEWFKQLGRRRENLPRCLLWCEVAPTNYEELNTRRQVAEIQEVFLNIQEAAQLAEAGVGARGDGGEGVPEARGAVVSCDSSTEGRQW